MALIHLHTHRIASHGLSGPAQLVAQLGPARIRTFTVTCHDSVAVPKVAGVAIDLEALVRHGGATERFGRPDVPVEHYVAFAARHGTARA